MILDRINRDALYTAKEAAEIVGVNPSLIFRAASVLGELEHVRTDRRKSIRIPGSGLADWVLYRWGVDAPTGKHAARNRATMPINGVLVQVERRKRGYTLQTLSDASGVARTTLGRIESSGANAGCRRDTAMRIAKALGMSPEDLGSRKRQRLSGGSRTPKLRRRMRRAKLERR